MCEVLGLAVFYDRLDASNLAQLELVARRLVITARLLREELLRNSKESSNSGDVGKKSKGSHES